MRDEKATAEIPEKFLLISRHSVRWLFTLGKGRDYNEVRKRRKTAQSREVFWMTWRNVLMAIFGAWFVVSAWALNPMNSDAYLFTAIVLGGLTLIGSVWALADRARRVWRCGIEALFGLYLGLTPFFYSF